MNEELLNRVQNIVATGEIVHYDIAKPINIAKSLNISQCVGLSGNNQNWVLLHLSFSIGKNKFIAMKLQMGCTSSLPSDEKVIYGSFQCKWAMKTVVRLHIFNKTLNHFPQITILQQTTLKTYGQHWD